MTNRLSDDELLHLLDDRPERVERYLDEHPDAGDRLEVLTALEPELGARSKRRWRLPPTSRPGWWLDFVLIR